MQTLKPHKRGDTFAFYANITDNTGSPYIGDVNNLRCQIRDLSDKLVSSLNVSATETPGQYLLRADSTDTWIAGTTLYMDIEIKIDDIVSSSDTITIPVVKDVTHDD